MENRKNESLRDYVKRKGFFIKSDVLFLVSKNLHNFSKHTKIRKVYILKIVYFKFAATLKSKIN